MPTRRLQIDDGVGGGAPHTLPAGSLLAPGAYPGGAAQPDFNNDGDSVRLLRPDGSLADTVDFAGSAADQSLAIAPPTIAGIRAICPRPAPRTCRHPGPAARRRRLHQPRRAARLRRCLAAHAWRPAQAPLTRYG
ncbi:MAG: hypothetical protein U0Z44_18985 [Kouleothrix sp.]